MPTPILTDFDRDLLLDLRIGRRIPKRPDAAVQESLEYLRAHGLFFRVGGDVVVTSRGRRASVEGACCAVDLWREEAALGRDRDGGSTPVQVGRDSAGNKTVQIVNERNS